MRYLLALLGLLVVASTANAELAICFDATRPLGSQFIHNPSIDPSKVTSPNCSVVTAASGQTASQLTLINSTIRGVAAPRYLKCSPNCGTAGALAVSMTTAEMDAVDADLASKAAAQQVYIDEVNNQDFCSVANLAAVDTKVDQFYDASAATMTTAVNNVTSIATAKTAIQTVAQELSGQRVAMKKLLRCLISVRKGAR